jgi:hypothetical protein
VYEELPWFLLPDYPPEGRIWREIGNWIAIVFKAIMIAVLETLVLMAAYWFFNYFQGD